MQTSSTTTDPIRESLTGAVDQVVTAFQPQIEAYVNRFADQAIGRVETAAQHSVQTIENKPWILVGLAAVMLISAGFMIRANRQAL